MKKRICCVLIGIFLIVLLCSFYMEFRFGTTTVVSQGISPERILKEMPDIAVTSEEMSMAKALSQTREMEDAFLQAEISENEIFEFSMADAENLLQTYIPRGWNVLELTVLPKSAYLGFSKGEKRSVYYAFNPTGEIHEKTIGLYGRNLFGNRTVKAIFCNQNGQITKLKEKRLWFEWLKR